MLLRFKRFKSEAIDYLIVLLLTCPTIFYFETGNIYVGIFIMIMLSFKDLLFTNKSIGKIKMNLEVLTNDDKIPNKYVLYFRNFTLIIWPIEIIMIALFNKRIGDLIFGTKVVEITK